LEEKAEGARGARERSPDRSASKCSGGLMYMHAAAGSAGWPGLP